MPLIIKVEHAMRYTCAGAYIVACLCDREIAMCMLTLGISVMLMLLSAHWTHCNCGFLSLWWDFSTHFCNVLISLHVAYIRVS